MISNHITLQILTKGLISSFPIFNGIIIKYEVIYTGGIRRGNSYTDLISDIKRLNNDISVINVYVNWFKNPIRKKITAKLIETQITADMINESNEINKNIKINVIKLD